MLDIEFVRQQFPQLRHPETGEWAFFENAGGSYAPDQVVDKLVHFFTRTKVQPYYPFAASAEAGEAMDRSEQLLAAALNAAPDEVLLGPSTTMNVYVLAQALRAEMRPGDEIIVTNQDHEANIGAWWRLAETGIVVREWRVDPATGLLDVDALRGLISERTRLVCVTHASNVIAAVNPVREIADLAHDAGARVVVDGVSYAPHRAIDVQALGADFYLYSLYKTYGPHIGLMYARREHLEQMANQGHFFNAAQPNKRLTPAGPDHGEIASASGIVDYLDAVHARHFDTTTGRNTAERMADVHALFAQQEETLASRLLAFLTTRTGVRVFGPPVAERNTRMPTIAFVAANVANETIVKSLADAKIGCGFGNFYAYRLIEALGLDPQTGVTRISMVHYNTVAEIDRCIEALERIL